MVSFIKQLNAVDPRTKYGVYGWIRKAEQELKLEHIPMMINSIIILFYRDDEIFDVHGDDMKLSENKKKINLIRNNGLITWNNNGYGIIKIASISKIKCKWDLMLTEHDSSIYVGISSKQSPNTYFNRGGENGYYYIVHLNSDPPTHSRNWIYSKCYNSWTSYGTIANEEIVKTISVHLDLLKREIGFSFNGKYQGVAYKNIKVDESVEYQLMVTISEINHGVEITNFTTVQG